MIGESTKLAGNTGSRTVDSPLLIKENRMITMTKRFYMGTNHIGPKGKADGFLKLLSEAIEDAKEYLESNPECEERYIVEVVKVVRRERVPIVVESIRK
jgi:hypothetical protein